MVFFIITKFIETHENVFLKFNAILFLYDLRWKLWNISFRLKQYAFCFISWIVWDNGCYMSNLPNIHISWFVVGFFQRLSCWIKIILPYLCLWFCCKYSEQKTPCGSTIALLKSQPEVADLLISLFFVAASSPTEKGYVFCKKKSPIPLIFIKKSF